MRYLFPNLRGGMADQSLKKCHRNGGIFFKLCSGPRIRTAKVFADVRTFVRTFVVDVLIFCARLKDNVWYLNKRVMYGNIKINFEL